jgi:hypothetical protein
MMKTLKAFFDAMFKTPTVEDDIEQRKHRAASDIRHSDATLRLAEYQKHMALHELCALDLWEHGYVAKTPFEFRISADGDAEVETLVRKRV